jgi:HlyD family secretion protein
MAIAYGFARNQSWSRRSRSSADPFRLPWRRRQDPCHGSLRHFAPVASFAPRVRLEVGDPEERSDLASSKSRRVRPCSILAAVPRQRPESWPPRPTLGRPRRKYKPPPLMRRTQKEQKVRTEELYKSGDVPAERNDHAIAEARRTSAGLRAAQQAAKAAQAELGSARAVLRFSASSPAKGTPEKVVVRSPVSGRVLKVVHESEGPSFLGTLCLKLQTRVR